eukprot:SAG31_NODE_4134_length_3550_cov_8.625036_2_plen_160_part_00
MASSSSGVEFGNPLTVFDVDPPLTQLFEAEHARKRDARANDDPGDVGGSDDDSDDEDNLPPPSTSCQRFAVFCSNRTRLKRVKDLSAGVVSEISSSPKAHAVHLGLNSCGGVCGYQRRNLKRNLAATRTELLMMSTPSMDPRLWLGFPLVWIQHTRSAA